MSLTPALAAHAEHKLGSALMHVFDRPSARVDIALGALGRTYNRDDKTCKVTVSMPKGRVIVVSETDEDMYRAINIAHDRVLERVKRERGKHARPTRTRKMARARRHDTARQSLSAQRNAPVSAALWEKELHRYERSLARS